MSLLTFEASALGWLPGHWPLRFTYEGVDYMRRGEVFGCDCQCEDYFIYGSKESEKECWVSGEHLDPEGLGWEASEWPLIFDDVDGARYERDEMITQAAYISSPTVDFLGYVYVTGGGNIIKIYRENDSDEEESL